MDSTLLLTASLILVSFLALGRGIDALIRSAGVERRETDTHPRTIHSAIGRLIAWRETGRPPEQQ